MLERFNIVSHSTAIILISGKCTVIFRILIIVKCIKFENIQQTDFDAAIHHRAVLIQVLEDFRALLFLSLDLTAPSEFQI